MPSYPMLALVVRHGGWASTLAAVVLKWSRARKRYERQGLLVEAEALERARLRPLELRREREGARCCRRASPFAIRARLTAGCSTALPGRLTPLDRFPMSSAS